MCAKTGVFDRVIKGGVERGWKLEKVVLLEVCAIVQAPFVRLLAAIFDRRRRKVNAEYLETVFGQVKSFVTAPATRHKHFSPGRSLRPCQEIYQRRGRLSNIPGSQVILVTAFPEPGA